MKQFINVINDEIAKVFSNNDIDTKYADLKKSDKSQSCDYQLNCCFALAKEKKISPAEVGGQIVSLIKDISCDGAKIFETCEFCMPGFINININTSAINIYLNKMFSDKNLGLEVIYNDNESSQNIKNIKSVLYDYGGANIAKPLHVGHLRVAVIGEALKRLSRKLGINAVGDIHMGDYGLPMGLVIEQLRDEGIENTFTIDDLQRVYPLASKRSKEIKPDGSLVDPDFDKRAHDATKALQNDEEPYKTIWDRIVELSIADLKERYGELNVEFDYYYGESTVKDIMGPMCKDLIDNKIAKESDGAYIIDVSREDDKKEMPPCILLKTDGAYLYSTSDLGTICFREKNFNIDEYVYVVDYRQSLHLEQVFRAAKIARLCKENKKFHHVAVGTMNGTDGKPFKSRDGGVLKLETLISDAKDKALEQLKNSGRDMEGIDLNDLAHKIAVATIKYGDLSNSPTRDYVFNLDTFSQFQGNTGPYILYTVVRIKSLFRKLGVTEDKYASFIDNLKTFDTSLINNKLLKDISLHILRFKNTLYTSYEQYDPSILCRYIYELADMFSSFYNDCSIVGEQNSAIKNYYIAICIMVYKTINEVLGILAIDVPDKM